jgi:hypothetical protein
MIGQAYRLPDRTLAHQYAVGRHVAAAQHGETAHLAHLSRLCAARLWCVAFALSGPVTATELTTAVVAQMANARAPADDGEDAELAMLRRICEMARRQAVGPAPLTIVPAAHRTLFALTQFGGLSYSEAAAVTGDDVAVVRNACAAARTALIALSEPLCGLPAQRINTP